MGWEKYHGYIDLGTQLNDDSLPLAKEALTFMVVAINDSFKMPVGYFLIDGLGGIERANITCEFLRKLHDAGITIASLTFDGCASNICMVRNLGCNLDIKSFKPYFSHPVTNENVLIFLDPCHMLKLVRNTLGDKKRLVDRDGNVVDWKFIENLNQLQQDENLHLANKLRPKHLLWTKNKMNVNLAAQLLSESVGSSLEFCAQEHMANFIGCEPTVKFIRIVNGLFDVLTSRNLKAKGLKSPLQPCNYFTIRSFLIDARSYILSLMESPNGRPIIESNRKTGFLGFLICIDNTFRLYDFAMSSKFAMKFLCLFKISQDHIELFFGKIRRLGGCNNNPTSRQFSAAYKKSLFIVICRMCLVAIAYLWKPYQS